MRFTILATLFLWVFAPVGLSAQQIMLDRGARIEGLWVFPAAANPNHYYYLPNDSWIVPDDNGDPQFSFLRYVINKPSEGATSQGITEAEGGGILHFLVTYGVPEEVRKRAERAVRRLDPENEDLKLMGPVIFKEGRYALISSIVNTETGEEEGHLLATGNAPVLEGSQIALSFDLPPDRATLLMESLKMATPDISLIFEMTVEGVTDAFEADLIIRWDDVHKSKRMGVKAEVNVYYAGLSGDMGMMFDELMQNKSVELKTRGANDNMEALLDKVHNQLLELMFEPIPIDQSSDESDNSAFGAIQNFGKDKKTDAYGRKPITGMGVSAGYKMKETRSSGETVLSMNHMSSVTRVSTIGFNVGNLWEEYGDDPNIFKTVNLADDAFKQREIHVGIDGAILPEFEAYINSVTTVLRKQHQDGNVTVREVVVDHQTFKESAGNDFRMIYGWSGDDDRDAWLQYDFRTRWSFKGGGKYETGWTLAEANMIDLYAPYHRKVVKVYGDHEALVEQGVRAVLVEVDYPFFEGRKTDKLRIRADRPIEDQTLELTLPHDTNAYHYKITWIVSRGGKVIEEGDDSTGIIFIDELPEPAPSEEVAGATLGKN